MKLLDKIESNCFTYVITSIIKNRKYYGATTNGKSRYKAHYSKLLSNKHENSHLQNDFNKYGKDNFTFKILEYINVKDIVNKEQYYLDNIVKWGFDFNKAKYSSFDKSKFPLLKEASNKKAHNRLKNLFPCFIKSNLSMTSFLNNKKETNYKLFKKLFIQYCADKNINFEYYRDVTHRNKKEYYELQVIKYLDSNLTLREFARVNNINCRKTLKKYLLSICEKYNIDSKKLIKDRNTRNYIFHKKNKTEIYIDYILYKDLWKNKRQAAKFYGINYVTFTNYIKNEDKNFRNRKI